MFHRPALTSLALAAALWAAVAPAEAAPSRLFVDPASSTLAHSTGLSGAARADAQLLGSFASGTWFSGRTPAQVQAAAKRLVDAAAADDAVPVLVAYNLPFRDCSQFSAGGAADKAAYKAWIDALAAGIGRRRAVIIIEPDGLGIIPFHTDLNGQSEWCRPFSADPASAANDRYELLNYAVDKLRANPNAALYLDGTHSGWLSVGDIARRLVKAGALRANGFFLNASNYQPTASSHDYGDWISQCIHYANNPAEGGWRLGHYEHCASQYAPATAGDAGTWGLTRQWYIDHVTQAANPPSGPGALLHFVIDTSRNGQGPWVPPADARYPDPQTWCNPPGRGLGAPPSLQTDHPLVDAYLWIKVPGESDGPCERGTAGRFDPARGQDDPAAGHWFVQQAAELIALSDPPVARPVCEVQVTVHGSWPGGFNAQVWIKNIGSTPITGWSLAGAQGGGQTIQQAWGPDAGTRITAGTVEGDHTLAPGTSLSIGLVGKAPGAVSSARRFTLGGAPCVGVP